MKTTKSFKKYLSILIVSCIVALVFVTIVTADNTATNWTLNPEADVEINIHTTGSGSNLVFYATLSVDGETTISITVPGKDYGSGTFDAYLTIGGYIVHIPIQGNQMGKRGDPTIISGIGANHDWKEQGRSVPTCTEDGYISYKCQNHAEVHIDVLPALGHDFSIVTVDATCLVDGSITTTCSRCDYETVEVLAALGHDFSILTGHKDPDCETQGYDLLKCSRCDRVLTRVIPDLGHNWGEWTVTKEPTCEEEGEETQICKTDSSHIQTRPIPKLYCYTIIYAPGDFGTWNVSNNTYNHLLYGDATPDFKEDPYTNHSPGWNFTGWDPVIDPTVSCSVTYTAQWEPEDLVVDFKDWNGALLKSEKVLYGTNATAPTNPARAGYHFVGWDVSFINVTSNLVVTAQYTQITTNNGSSSSSSSNSSSSSSSSSNSSSSNDNLPSDAVEYRDTETSIISDNVKEPLVTWAFVNLALSIAGILLVILVAIGVMLQQKSENNKTKQNVAGQGKQHNALWLVVMIALSGAGIVLFLLTQNMQSNMVVTDNWTIVNAIIFTIELIPIALIFKSKKAPN